MFHAGSPVMKGALLSILGFAMFSVGDVIAKLLTAHSHSVFMIVWCYSAVSIPVLAAVAPKFGGLRRSVFSPKWKLQLLRSVFSLANGLLIFYGLTHIALDKIYTILFTAPFFSAMLAIPLLKEKVGVHRWSAIAVGFCGVLIALRPGAMPFDPALFGVLLAALLFALINLMVKIIGDDEPPLSFSLYPSCFRVLCLTPLLLLNFSTPSAGDVVLLVAGGAATGIALIVMALAFRFAPASVAAPFHYTQMIWGILAGVFIFGDYPDSWTLVGAAVITASGLYLIYRESLAHKSSVRKV